MAEDDLADHVRRLLVRTARLDVDPASIALDRPLVGEGGLGVHSLEVFELVCALEDELGVTVTDDAIPTLRTVGAIVEHVRRQRSA